MLLPVLPYMVARQSSIAGMEEKWFDNIALFRDRVEKLAASQRKYQGIPTSQVGRIEATGELVFDANTPDIDHVVILALKFRFFYAQGEPTQFETVLTNVRRRTQDAWACGYLDWLAEHYKGAMKSTNTSEKLGLPVTNRKIIDLWFNSELFHSDYSKKVELTSIHERIGDVPSLFQLYLAIVKCSSYIKMLYSVVHLLSQEQQFIYTPNHHFR